MPQQLIHTKSKQHRIAHGYGDDRARARAAALPPLTAQERARKAGKCSPSPTYPPATTSSREVFIIGFRRKEKRSQAPHQPDIAAKLLHGLIPAQKPGPVFFARKKRQKSSSPTPRGALLTRSKARFVLPNAHGRNGGTAICSDRTEELYSKKEEKRLGGGSFQ
jgi:hypothetical protein